jgi:hypothetical protein
MPRYSRTGKNLSASVHASQGHPCSCGRMIFGNGYGQHRRVCDGRWLTWSQWVELQGR